MFSKNIGIIFLIVAWLWTFAVCLESEPLENNEKGQFKGITVFPLVSEYLQSNLHANTFVYFVNSREFVI